MGCTTTTTTTTPHPLVELNSFMPGRRYGAMEHIGISMEHGPLDHGCIFFTGISEPGYGKIRISWKNIIVFTVCPWLGLDCVVTVCDLFQVKCCNWNCKTNRHLLSRVVTPLKNWHNNFLDWFSASGALERNKNLLRFHRLNRPSYEKTSNKSERGGVGRISSVGGAGAVRKFARINHHIICLFEKYPRPAKTDSH